MVLEWREHDHGEVEEAVTADLMAQQALRACGLYKFWCLGGLRTKPRLLQMLVDYWDPDSVLLDRWDVPHYRGGGHILHFWAF